MNDLSGAAQGRGQHSTGGGVLKVVNECRKTKTSRSVTIVTPARFGRADDGGASSSEVAEWERI